MRSLQCTRVIRCVTLPDAVSYNVESSAALVTRNGSAFSPASLTFSTYKTVNGTKTKVSDQMLAYEVNGQQCTGTYTPKAGDTWPLTVKSYDDTGDTRKYLCETTVGLVNQPDAVSYDIVPNASTVVRSLSGTFDPVGLVCRLFQTVNGTRSQLTPVQASAIGRFVVAGQNCTPSASVIYGYDPATTTFPLEVKFVRTSDNAVLATTMVTKIDEVEGPDGPVIQVSEWDEHGLYYYNGDNIINGVRPLDVVYLRDGSSRKILGYYRCIKNHKSEVLKKPDTDTNDWQVFHNIRALFANTLYAENARIEFLGGQEIVIYGTVKNGNSESSEIFGRLGSPLESGSVMHMGGKQPSEAGFNLDMLGNARFGLLNGPYVEIKPQSRDMLVHGWLPLNSAGTQNELGVVARFTGQNVTVPSAGTDDKTTTDSNSSLTWQSSGGAIQSRQFKLNIPTTENMSQLSVTVPVKLTTDKTGYVPASGNPDPGPIVDGGGGSGGTGTGTVDYVREHTKTAEIQVFAELVLMSSATDTVGTVYGSASRGIVSGRSNNSDSAAVNLTVNVSNAPAGIWYLRLRSYGSVVYDNTDTEIPTWKAVIGTATITRRYVRFTSIYGKGGFYAGTSSLCHVAAISNCNPTASGTDMMFEALSKGTGIKVNDGAIATQHKGLGWVYNPIVLFRGALYIDGEGHWAVAGHGLNGKIPVHWAQLTDISGYTSFRLGFPDEWITAFPNIVDATSDKFMVQVIASHDNPAMTSGYKDKRTYQYTENGSNKTETRPCAIVRLKFDDSSGSKRFNIVITYYPT